MRRFAGSGWGAGAKILRTAALSLVYSTAEYCAPVWCRSAHTCLIDSVLNDALRIVTGCLRPNLPVLAGIQPAELRRLGATLSLAYRGSVDPDHILYELWAGSPDGHRERINSRRPFVRAARKLLQDLTELDIRAAQGTDFKRSKEYSECSSDLRAFIPRASTRAMGMGLPRSSWVRLNRLRAGVGCFQSFMHKWDLASTSNCECGAAEQTAGHIILTCPVHRAPTEIRGLTVLPASDFETVDDSTTLLSCCCFLTWMWILSKKKKIMAAFLFGLMLCFF